MLESIINLSWKTENRSFLKEERRKTYWCGIGFPLARSSETRLYSVGLKHIPACRGRKECIDVISAMVSSRSFAFFSCMRVLFYGAGRCEMRTRVLCLKCLRISFLIKVIITIMKMCCKFINSFSVYDFLVLHYNRVTINW